MTFIDRGNQTPQLLEQDRPWEQARPQPRPQQAALFSGYTDVRDPQDWATPDWRISSGIMNPDNSGGTDFPGTAQAYPMLASSTGYLARWGSPAVAEPARRVSQAAMSFAPLLDMLSKGAFSRNFNASSLQGLKIRQQQMLMDQEAMQEAHSRQLIDYGTIFSAYDSKGISDEEARERLFDLATQYGDDPLKAMLQNQGGLEKARTFLNQQDQKFREAWASAASLKKATGTDEDIRTAEEWGVTPNRTGMGGGGIMGAPTPVPGEETRGPRTPQMPEGGDFNANLARQMHLSPREMQAIQEWVATGKMPADVAALGKGPNEAEIRKQIAGGVGATRKGLMDIAQGPDMVDGKSKMDRLNAINPALGTTVDGLRTYAINPTSMQDRPYLIGLTKTMFPNWKQGFYNTFNNVWNNDQSREGMRLAKSTTLPTAYENLVAAINQLPGGEGAVIPENEIQQLYAEKWAGSPQYSRLNGALRAFAVEAIAALGGNTQGGAPVSFVNQMLKHSDVTASRAMLRTVARDEMVNAQGAIESTNRRFKLDSGLADRDAPGIFQEDRDVFSAVARSNPYKGTYPEGPAKLKILEPTAEDSRKRPSWWDEKKYGWDPMNPRDYDDALDFIQKNPANPSAKALARQLGLMR